MKSWKTTLGGSLSALGTSLMGFGVVSQFSGSSSNLLTGMTVTGFIFSALGTFFAHLFAADQTAVINALTQQQASNTAGIAAVTNKPTP